LFVRILGADVIGDSGVPKKKKKKKKKAMRNRRARRRQLWKWREVRTNVHNDR
jgi:hypothetical protein